MALALRGRVRRRRRSAGDRGRRLRDRPVHRGTAADQAGDPPPASPKARSARCSLRGAAIQQPATISAAPATVGSVSRLAEEQPAEQGRPQERRVFERHQRLRFGAGIGPRVASIAPVVASSAAAGDASRASAARAIASSHGAPKLQREADHELWNVATSSGLASSACWRCEDQVPRDRAAPRRGSRRCPRIARPWSAAASIRANAIIATPTRPERSRPRSPAARCASPSSTAARNSAISGATKRDRDRFGQRQAGEALEERQRHRAADRPRGSHAVRASLAVGRPAPPGAPPQRPRPAARRACCASSIAL